MRPSDSNKSEVGECLYRRISPFTKPSQAWSICLLDSENKNSADLIGGCNTADLQNPQKSPNPGANTLKLLNI